MYHRATCTNCDNMFITAYDGVNVLFFGDAENVSFKTTVIEGINPRRVLCPVCNKISVLIIAEGVLFKLGHKLYFRGAKFGFGDRLN